MSLPEGACLEIRLTVTSEGSRAVFIPADSAKGASAEAGKNRKGVAFTGDLLPHQLAAVIRDVRTDLAKVREGLGQVGALGQNEASAGRALKRLSERGWRLLKALLGDDVGAINEASAICRACRPTWNKPAWDKEATRPPLVTVVTRRDDGIPVEILPLFDPAPIADAPANRADVGEVACRFLGFSTVVERQHVRSGQTRSPGSGRRLENRPLLPVETFYYRGLPNLYKQEKFFSDNASRIDLIPSWPVEGVPTDREFLARELANRLWDMKRKQQPQISYFFCHCDTEGESTERHALRFHTGGNILGIGGERRVELGDLDSAISVLRLASGSDDENLRPLVFLNACASGTIDPSGVGSFPKIFSDRRFLGFIGTESAVPDAFASAFAQDFLGRLLDGTQLGDSLHQARWAMLGTHLNPLGLLYTAYADPDLQVRYPAPRDPLRSATTGEPY